MIKWLKNILGIAITAFLVWYLWRHWNQLRGLLNLTAGQLIVIYAVSLWGNINTSLNVKYLLAALGVKSSLMDMILLQNATSLLNYAPMKFGTLFQANFLKRHFGLKYAHYGTFATYLVLLSSATASVTGLAVCVTVYGLAAYATQILATAFLLAAGLSLALLLLPLPIPAGKTAMTAILRNFLLGRKSVSADLRTVTICTVLLAGNFVLLAVRLWIIYYSLGQHLHPAAFLVLGALGFVTILVSLTPGSLGVRELVLGAGAAAMGTSLEVGILAAMIDRAVVLSWSFTVGAVCTAVLWRKSPADFKRENAANQG